MLNYFNLRILVEGDCGKKERREKERKKRMPPSPMNLIFNAGNPLWIVRETLPRGLFD